MFFGQTHLSVHTPYCYKAAKPNPWKTPGPFSPAWKLHLAHVCLISQHKGSQFSHSRLSSSSFAAVASQTGVGLQFTKIIGQWYQYKIEQRGTKRCQSHDEDFVCHRYFAESHLSEPVCVTGLSKSTKASGQRSRCE